MYGSAMHALLSHLQHDLQDIISCIEHSRSRSERISLEVRLAVCLGMVDRILVILMEEGAIWTDEAKGELPF